MKLLLDENVPVDIISNLKRAGHDVEHVNKKCKGLSDNEVLEYAKKNKRTIISFDSDFCNLRKREHYGIIKVDGKIKNPVTLIIELLKQFKDKDIKNIYFQINEKSVFKEEKKYGKKHKWIFKQFHRTYINLECLTKNKSINIV